MEVYHARSDRTWYTIQLEMTDFGLAGDKPINLTHALDSQIKAAQAVKLNQALKGEVDEFRAMQHKLNTVKYEQSVLDDGNYLYQFSDGTSVLQYINKGAVDFKQVSGTELEDLKGRIQGKISAGDVLKLGAAGIGCGLGVLTAPTGVGALVAAGTCGVVGGLTVKNVIESDATVQDGVVDVVLTGAFLGAGNLVGGLAKNAAGLLKNVPGVNQAGNLVKNLPGVSQVGNLVKNIPGASQLTNLAQNAGNLVSGSGSLIRENGAKILRVIPNQGSVKQFMDTTGKLLFEPGAWRSPSVVSAASGVKAGIAKTFETLNPFKAKVPPISTETAVHTSTAVVPPVAAATPPVAPIRTATPSSATSLIYSATRHDPVK